MAVEKAQVSWCKKEGLEREWQVFVGFGSRWRNFPLRVAGFCQAEIVTYKANFTCEVHVIAMR